MSAGSPAEWVCCHLGAREHYVIPRALHGAGRLRALITDAWVEPGSSWSRLPGESAQRIAERWHPDLAGASVHHSTTALVAREALWRAQPDGWVRLMKRNGWFGRRAATTLRAMPGSDRTRTVVFAHSYSALEVFEAAKSRGFTTVLGQIDPGPEHFRIAQRAADERPQYGPAPEPPPARYLEAWHTECRRADWIVVNSEWSRDLLERAGVPAAKLRVVPLVYDPPVAHASGDRAYPDHFTRARPLRVLFVGHVSVTKGAAALLEALALLVDVPVELRMVGSVAMDVPRDFVQHEAVRWIGPVSRSDVMHHYRDCDVLVFPSLSDGFGMAQIEAQAWHLPIIASRSCGRVVCDGVNGLLLDEPTPIAIASAIRRVAADGTLLQQFSRAAAARSGGVPELASALLQLEPA